MDVILTIDIGTSSVRGIIYDLRGNSLLIKQIQNEPEFLKDNLVEQEPGTWIKCVDDILDETFNFLRLKDYKLKGISLTSQRTSLIPVDREGNALSKAIMWQDRRTTEICEEFSKYNELIYSKSGLKVSPVFTAPKILWIKRNRPELYEKTYKMMGIQDFIMNYLSGSFKTDRSLASRTNLFNLKDKEWDVELIQLFGLDREKICDLIDPGDICGDLKESLKNVYGITGSIPIISAGGDQQCAALGLGVISQGDIEINTGTGGFIIAHSSKPIFDPEMRIFCNLSSIPGEYIVEASILTSGAIYNWFNKNFYSEKLKDGFEEINNEAINSPPGANGVILAPHFKGSGTPNWNPDAKGLFYNISLETKRGDMARSILEGIVSEMKEGIELLEEIMGSLNKIVVAGGLSKLQLYNQIQADIFERKIQKSLNGEATAVGALISAAVALGYYPSYEEAFYSISGKKGTQDYLPNQENFMIYRELCSKKKYVYKTLY